MNLATVMDQIAARLDTSVANLHVYAYPPDSIQPPAAVVGLPESYTYDETYGRGMDRLTLPVVVLVGKVSDRASRDQIAVWTNGSGADSIKQILETFTYPAFDSVRVMDVEFDVIRMNEVNYLAATFTLDIAGQGA